MAKVGWTESTKVPAAQKAEVAGKSFAEREAIFTGLSGMPQDAIDRQLAQGDGTPPAKR